MYVEGLLVVLIFSLTATVVLLAYMYQTLCKQFKETTEEFTQLKDLFLSLYYEFKKEKKE